MRRKRKEMMTTFSEKRKLRKKESEIDREKYHKISINGMFLWYFFWENFKLSLQFDCFCYEKSFDLFLKSPIIFFIHPHLYISTFPQKV